MLFFVSVSFALPIPKQSTWFPCSLRYEKRAVKLDAALVFRVNDRSRTDSPATEWAYAHYRTHMTASIALTLQDKLAGFILNVSLVRNTLSLRMRKLLRAGELCWLKTTGGIVSNFEDLDEFVYKCGCKELFGDFVNPMLFYSLSAGFFKASRYDTSAGPSTSCMADERSTAASSVSPPPKKKLNLACQQSSSGSKHSTGK